MLGSGRRQGGNLHFASITGRFDLSEAKPAQKPVYLPDQEAVYFERQRMILFPQHV